MTDTPSGARDDPRVHGDASALADVTVRKLDTPIPLSPAEAEAAFQPHTISSADPAPVLVDATVLVPSLTALVRWLLQGFGIWLINHGMTHARADSLVTILTGLGLSGGALTWSIIQKHLAAHRIMRAARADPRRVRLRL